MQGASKRWCGTLGTSSWMGGAFPGPRYGVLQCECPYGAGGWRGQKVSFAVLRCNSPWYPGFMNTVGIACGGGDGPGGKCPKAATGNKT